MADYLAVEPLVDRCFRQYTAPAAATSTARVPTMKPAAVPLSVWEACSLLIGADVDVSGGLGVAEAVAEGAASAVAAGVVSAATVAALTGVAWVAGASAGTPSMTGFSVGV